MKLQRQKAREYKGESIYKWVIVIPPEDIKKLGWKEGDQLSGVVKLPDRYILEPIKK